MRTMEVCTSKNTKSSRLYNVFVTFCFMGTPAGRQKNSIIQPTGRHQFNLNILLVFEMALIIKHNVEFAVLFVHTVHTNRFMNSGLHLSMI